jgi:ABC-type amino acid transport system permease subunit
MIRRALETPALYALGAMATLVAALVGTVLAMIITFPLSLFAVLFFPLLIAGVVSAAVLAAPVTFLLLPLTAQLMRGHPILAQLAIPLVGFVAGGAAISGWIAVGILPHDSWGLYGAIGMISGLSGGAFFGRGLHA